MIPFRRNVAIAIDGGGIRGAIVTRALAMLEEHLGKSCHQVFRLVAGTSTGSIIAAGIAAGLSGRQLDDLYQTLGGRVFRRSWRTLLFPLSRYRYNPQPFQHALEQYFGDRKLGDFWTTSPPTDVVITTFDLAENRTRFLKPWKLDTRDWSVVKAVMASSTVPTYFPVVEGRYVDGGVGSYANPCYLAAYELRFCLNWDPAETTLISLGTGRSPHNHNAGAANRLHPWQWINPLFNAFIHSADDQQVHLVDTFFRSLDFRRFQVDLREPVEMDDAAMISQLAAYGDELGRKILCDEMDPILEMATPHAPKRRGI